MSYQVLARKWRPKNFESLVGQEHVVRALSHALEHKRLHHAYLFTGTRGVGKTTLARILAKSLNCIGADGKGDVTAHPCGVCQPCLEIDAGRFVDYLEMDAASNRGVDEMAQLLEQAVYSPANARFKVYMIDEVHMLSSHAFNSMLKTLEEPPDYVKFILATTDQQKIPVTVLSRCLQFNLKQMLPAQIAEHLHKVLTAEEIAFEPGALALLGRAANGSMRDALSLTDQAIAYDAGALSEAAVRTMLGALDQTYLIRIVDALAANEGASLLAIADELVQRSLSLRAALQDLSSLLHRIALVQVVPGTVSSDWEDSAAVERFAASLPAEQIQLFYEICNRGRADIERAPDEYAGFTMTLLRMLAFRPLAAGGTQATGLAGARAQPAAPGVRAAPPVNAPRATEPAAVSVARAAGSREAVVAPAAPIVERRQALEFDGDWIALAAQLKVTGLVRQLVQQAELVAFGGDKIELRVPIRTLLDAGALEKLKLALREHFGRPIQLAAQVGSVQGTTVARRDEDERSKRQAQAVDAIQTDPFVKALVKDFGATIVPGSIKPTP